jgi:hypothetical protein
MHLEIRPEPSDQEQAAIAAALEQEAEPAPAAWPQSALPRHEELDEP